MTQEMLALASRAVACPKWRWMPGMRAVGQYPGYPVRVHEFGESVRDTEDMEEPEPWGWQQPARQGDHACPGPYLPDLTDPATVGCIVALLRETRKDPYGCVCVVTLEPSMRFACAWVSGPSVAKVFRLASTEAEALIIALEDTP
ncbi:MAG: hypothetical protein EB084_23290 [Proteobacteria bacterium]|nr:hypothetical protein [Pseudomonadota bacterium]